MHLKQTQRGFDIGVFTDFNGVECSIQKSSVATDDLIWLGPESGRMHLTRAQVENLLPNLQKFAETGDLQ